MSLEQMDEILVLKNTIVMHKRFYELAMQQKAAIQLRCEDMQDTLIDVMRTLDMLLALSDIPKDATEVARVLQARIRELVKANTNE